MTALEILKQTFGYDQFRDGQQQAVEAVTADRDLLAIMPTGAGKSLCYQVPALLKDGITLVVSPLISLMQDQVGALRQAGVPAAFINSSLSPKQVQMALYNAKQGQYKLIYVAPERLLSYDFLDFARSVTIEMVTVDEAHCISQWGQDFRPSYLGIGEFVSQLAKRPVLSAFTATATARVQEDIALRLGLVDPCHIVTGFDRENLHFAVEQPATKMKALLAFLEKHRDESGIIYCSTRKDVERVCEKLQDLGLPATRYHGGLGDNERKRNQEEFLFDRLPIMVATNAFGMGIDKSNVAFVFHYNMPKDMESYYQEAGRAGRDGTQAFCHLLYNPTDASTGKWLIENGNDRESVDPELEQMLREQAYGRLDQMVAYATSTTCLRHQILSYFGDTPVERCDNCSNCNTVFLTQDVTVEAQKILSCIVRMRESYGAKTVIDVLRGSESKKIKGSGLDKLSTYNISSLSVTALRDLILYMVQTGYLCQTRDEFPILRLTATSADLLKGNKTLTMEVRQKVEKTPTTDSVVTDTELVARLRQLRRTLAQEQGVPPFFIFSDRTLEDMGRRLPQTQDQFRQVMGVGRVKQEQYGETFVEEIVAYCQENNIEQPETPLLQTKTVDIQTLPNEKDLGAKEIALALNEGAGESLPKISPIKLTNWLITQGLLQVVTEDGHNSKVPTELGLEQGIFQETRTGQNGTYTMNRYPTALQQFILDNVVEIATT